MTLVNVKSSIHVKEVHLFGIPKSAGGTSVTIEDFDELSSSNRSDLVRSLFFCKMSIHNTIEDVSIF